MKYVKPQLQILGLALDKAVASGGLDAWLEGNGFEASAQNNITTYEVNS